MELFGKLFRSLLVFVYHCFDRIVINGYLSGLSRTGGPLLPPGARHSGGEQRGAQPTY